MDRLLVFHSSTAITKTLFANSLLFSILVGTSINTANAQTKAEVEAALRSYFADDDEQASARKQLKAWGVKATPFLRELAGSKPHKRSADSYDWALVCVLGELKTDGAITVLTDILAGKTGVDRAHALNRIRALITDPGVRIKLQDQPGFEASVTSFASSKSFANRIGYLNIASTLGWTDAIETVRDLLKDDNLKVRKHASAALATLTGDAIDVLEPPTVFRKRRIDPAVLEEPVEVPYKKGWASRVGSFTKGFDGKPYLIWGRGKQFGAFQGDGEKHANIDLEQFAHEFLALDIAESPIQMIALVSDSKHGEAKYAIGKNRTGEQLWTYKPPKAGIRHAQILHSKTGAYATALAVGGETGIIAIDHEGKTDWQVPKQYIPDRLSTHPDLPGLLLFTGGFLSLVHHQPGRAKVETLSLKGIKLHAHHALLFPDREQKPAILAAGSTSHSEPMIARYDTAGKMKWRIILPSSVGGLAMIETSDWGRLFAAATTDGKLFVFDADGALRNTARLPGSGEKQRTHIYGLAAGAIEGKQQAILVHLLRGSYLYRVGEKD